MIERQLVAGEVDKIAEEMLRGSASRSLLREAAKLIRRHDRRISREPYQIPKERARFVSGGAPGLGRRN